MLNNHDQKAIILIFVFIFSLVLVNCAPKQEPITKEYTLPYTNNLRPEDFQKEISRLEEITIYHPNRDVRTKTHLQLAFLHLSYRNPSPNYQQALEELESYVSLDPDGGKTDEIQNWLAILRQMKSVLRENRNMKRNIGDLNKENINIKETIEKLKRLDLQLKRKRENIR